MHRLAVIVLILSACESRPAEACNSTNDCLDDAYGLDPRRQRHRLVAERRLDRLGDQPVLAGEHDRVIDALDGYVAMADPLDPDLAGMKFTAASALYRWRQPDAIERLERLLREHRDDPTAENAANQLLDLLMRSERIAELRMWVAELLADEAFLAGKEALRETLERLRAMR